MRKIVVPRSRSTADVIPQVRPVLRVEAGRRLVEEQHLGLVDDPERDVEPPALAAGVGLDATVGEAREVEQLEQLARRARATAPSRP